MDISKYLKNEDVKISNEDIDIEKLTGDLRKGYVVEKDLTEKLQKAHAIDLETKAKEYTDKIAHLQNDYDSLVSKYDATTNELKTSNLKNAILSHGFRGTDIEEVVNLRTTMYKDITDDNEALSKVKERYGKVYFDEKSDTAPNEGPMNNTPPEVNKPVITRNTNIKDLMKN